MNASLHPRRVHRRAPTALVALITTATAVLGSAPALGGSSPPGMCFTDVPGTIERLAVA
jgi:hypothetical protein